MSTVFDATLQALAMVLGPEVALRAVAETGSTNSDLLLDCREGTGPQLLVAERQTAGRGRLGRSWQALPGDSLTFSLAWPLSNVPLDGLSLAVGSVLAEPLDPHFDGFGELVTGPDGRYAFTTIKPVAYRTSPTPWRPAHIHFRVTTRLEQFVTQMYFAGDPYNETDPFLRSARRPEALIVDLLPPGPGEAPESRRVEFNIALATG